MTRFIFEDSDISPVSELLRLVYKDGVVLFSNGNMNLTEKLYSVHNNEDEFVVFMDVPPNNLLAKVLFLDVSHDLAGEKYSNVVLVPIICIEYFVVRLLDSYGLNTISVNYRQRWASLVPEVDWNALDIKDRTISLEKLYKSLLSNQIERCFYNDTKHGQFYKESCGCRSHHCKADVEIDRIQKSLDLWMSLPVFDDDFKVEYDNSAVRNITSVDIISKMQTFFDDLCQQIGVSIFPIRQDGKRF